MRWLASVTRDQLLIYVSTLLWGFGLSLFFYIQPLYIARLGASPAQIGLVLGLGGSLTPFLYIPIGLWADRHGRRPLIRAGWGLGAGATLAMALAPDWRWLIPGLAAYQLANFALPAFYGYIVASNAGQNLNRVFAVIGSAASVGSIVAPALGGWIGEQFGLRAVYFCAAIIFTFSSLAIWFLSDQPVEGPAHRASPRLLLSSRPFLWQIIFVLLLFFAIELGQVMAPNFLEDVRGLSVSQIGWLGTLGSLGVVLLTLLLGQMRSERRGSLILGQMVALLALVLLVSTSTLALISLAYFIHGSNRLIRPIIDGRIAHSLNAASLSFGYGLRETAMRLGLAGAPYIAGLLYAYDPSWPLYAGIAGLTVMLLLTFTLPTDARAHAPAAIQGTGT